jgi:hypothetical protein
MDRGTFFRALCVNSTPFREVGGTESNERSHLVAERIEVTRIQGNALEPSFRTHPNHFGIREGVQQFVTYILPRPL